MSKATSADDYKLISSFEAIRKTLMHERFSDRMEKPLAYWALPNDRRLPLAFLGRTLGDLLKTPYDELAATAGIGQKKIGSLVKLLHRATKDEPPAVPFGLTDLAGDSAQQPATRNKNGEKFDPSIVSEALWVQWRDTVRKHGLADQQLGRLAPTLQALPTVIWHTPLDRYLELPVAEIRQLKTHGEKRVRVVLEVFYVVNAMLAKAGNQHHLAIRLVPQFILPVSAWISEVLDRDELPSAEEIREHLTMPLLAQAKIDNGDTVHELAEGRLGVSGPAQSVRNQSRRMSVTRARVYQLLDECAKAMAVRWPEGRTQLNDLAAKFRSGDVADDAMKLFLMTRELFFPHKYESLADEADGGTDD